MLVSYQHKFIFIHVYKTGGTSFTSSLSQYSSNQKIFNRALGRLPIKQEWLPLNLRRYNHHIRAVDLRKLLPADVYDSFFKFAIVRNPWDWQVSMYHHLLQITPRKNRLARDVQEMPSFEHFVHHNPWKHLQKDYVTDSEGNLIVDYLGRFENITEASREVFDKIGFRYLSLPHLRKSSHKDYRSYYTEETYQAVSTYYKDDIDFFGYDFDKKN